MYMYVAVRILCSCALIHLFPADGFYRVPYSELMEDEAVPSIPVQPLSYGDAVHFLSQLEEHDVPNSDWEGGLNITYKIAQAETNTK